MSTTKPVSVPPKRLAEEITSSAVAFKLNDILSWDGVNNIAAADFGSVAYGVFRNDTNTQIEFFQYDPSTLANYATTGITINLRGLSYNGTSLVEDSSRKFSWPRNETIVELGAHVPQLLDDVVSKGRDTTVTGTVTFTQTAMPRLNAAHTYGAGEEEYLATKRYVDGVALAGAPDASTTQKGVVEEATDAELQAGTATGGTGARLFAGGASHTQTPTANKVLVAKSTGKIDQGWLDLTATWTFTGIVDILAASWKLGGVAFTGTMALLNEAATFFGLTDITGTEAETLTNGSSALGLHYHPSKVILATRDQQGANGAVTYAHGLGGTPKNVEIFMRATTADSHGYYDGTSNMCIYNLAASTTGQSATESVHYQDVNGSQSGVITVDATNITITWTKGSAPNAGTMYIMMIPSA